MTQVTGALGPGTADAGSPRSGRGVGGQPPPADPHRPQPVPAHQAAHHRAAARHHAADDDAGRPRAAVGPADPDHAARRRAGGRQREHPELLHRPGHRRGHEADAPGPAAGGAATTAHGGPRRRARTAVKPGEALASGILLGAAATLLLGLAANWLAAALADAAILFYVFVYTLGLKRRTASNIVIGGAAGCFPVLVGWAAVTGKVSWWAGVLFAVIFFWTPPHFWALAMKFRDDYAAANVPMLPVVATPATVARKIVLYSYLMVAVTLLLTPYAGWIYGCCAARPRRLVPGRGAPAARPDRCRQRARADAAVPPVDRVSHAAVRRRRGDRAAALAPLVGACTLIAGARRP